MSPWVANNSNICASLPEGKIAYQVSWDRVTNQKEDCSQPCNFLLVNVGARNQFTHYKNVTDPETNVTTQGNPKNVKK